MSAAYVRMSLHFVYGSLRTVSSLLPSSSELIPAPIPLGLLCTFVSPSLSVRNPAPVPVLPPAIAGGERRGVE